MACAGPCPKLADILHYEDNVLHHTGDMQHAMCLEHHVLAWSTAKVASCDCLAVGPEGIALDTLHMGWTLLSCDC